MCLASFSVPLGTCVDAGKGDLPTVSDTGFHRQTTPSCPTHYSHVFLRVAELLTERHPPLQLAKIPPCR